MDAIVTRARTLLRQHVRATVALALIAGLGAGSALAFWSAARRSSSSFDRFLEADGQPDFLVSFCAPDATREEIESETGCPHYGARSEAATIRKMRGVRAVSRGSSVFGTYELRGSRTPGFIGTLIDDHDLATFAGRPKVTAGRLADPAVAHEIVVPEELAALYDLRVGDTAGFTATPEDPDRAPDATRLEVVGIVRTPADLVARLDPEGATFSNSLPLAGPAFWTRFGKQAQSWGTLVLVRVDHMEKQAFGAALRQRFPGRDFSVESARELEAERHADEAIGYETSVLYVATLVAAAAFLLFTGQALVRQSIREDADADTLVALGMTRRQLLGASALRATPAAAIAIVVAIFVAVISSAWSPTSVAAAAEVGNGFRFDAVVMLVGAAILGGVMVFGLSLATVRRAHDRSPSTVGSRFRRFRQTLPPAPRVGFSFVASPHHRTLSPLVAVGTVALAVALAIVGPGLAASLHDLVDHPRGYGTTWDLTLTGQGDPFLAGESFGPARRAVRAAPEVTAAAGLNVNNEGVIGGRAVPIVAFWPLAGPPRSWPVITAGRAPKARGEVALGAKTMDALGLSLGERTNLRMDPGKEPRRVAVVGEALVNDGFTVDAGSLAVVDPDWFGEDDERTADMIVMRTSAPPRIEVANVDVFPTPPPAGVRNLQRIDRAPTAIAAFIALLAIFVLGHALALVVGTERKQLAMLRALGCTRRQIAATLASSAFTVVGLGVVIGLPIGLLVNRLFWGQLQERIAFESAPAVSWESGLIIGVSVIAAGATGALFGWFSARGRPARDLRVE